MPYHCSFSLQPQYLYFEASKWDQFSSNSIILHLLSICHDISSCVVSVNCAFSSKLYKLFHIFYDNLTKIYIRMYLFQRKRRWHYWCSIRNNYVVEICSFYSRVCCCACCWCNSCWNQHIVNDFDWDSQVTATRTEFKTFYYSYWTQLSSTAFPSFKTILSSLGLIY